MAHDLDLNLGSSHTAYRHASLNSVEVLNETKSIVIDANWGIWS